MSLHWQCVLFADTEAAMTKWVGAMLAAVGLMRLLLLKNPLSEEAKPDADEPSQKGSPVASEAASSSPPGSSCDMMLHSPCPQAGPAATVCWQDTSAASAAPVGSKHSFLQVSTSNAMGMASAPRWRTPTRAAWKQISSMAARACSCLDRLAQASLLPELSATDDSALQAGLAHLLHGLLQGHWKDVDLDFQEILQEGLLPAVSLWIACKEMRHLHGPLVQFMLDRLVTEAVHGSWLQATVGGLLAQEIVSPALYLGTC